MRDVDEGDRLFGGWLAIALAERPVNMDEPTQKCGR